VHYVALELLMGAPFQYHGYVVHPATRIKGRNAEQEFNSIVGIVDPHVVMTHLDVHQTRFIKDRDFIWVANFPIDIEEMDMSMIDAVAKADVKVTETQISAGMLLRAKLPNVTSIPCAVDTDVFKPLGDAEKESMKANIHGVKPDDFVILFVGRPNWRKNFPTMLATLHELIIRRGHKNVKFVMHSDMSDPAAATNQSQWIKALDLNDNIIFTNNEMWDQGVEKKVLAQIYNMADVYFQPHGGEGFGITMAEAMACGLPVIATDYTSTKEMIGNNERGYRLPFRHMLQMMGVRRPVPDTMVCADALEMYINGKVDGKKQGRLGHEFAVENYSTSCVLEKWGKLLSKLEYRRMRAT